MHSRRMLMGAALALGVLACDARRGEQVKDAVSGQGCRDACAEQLKRCHAGCSDDLCRSDCTADSRMCGVQCSMPGDAGVDAGNGRPELPRASRPALMDAGSVDADLDAGPVKGGSAGSLAAGGGGRQAGGMGGQLGAGMGGTGAVAGAALPFAGSSGMPVAGRDLPVAGRRGPFAGDAP